MKLKIKFTKVVVFTLLICQISNAQNVEIQGQAKVTEMSNDNNIDEIVVRKPDGTLATRSAQSLPSSFEDTIRSLNTDLELAKHLCDCGTDLPPFLIESLLAAGYSEQDLLKAGVPVTNLTDNLPVIDLDGNEYDVVTIGTQKWLKQNLRVTQFNDGTAIAPQISNADWTQAIIDEEPAYTYPDGSMANVEEYGLIYSGYTTLSTYNGGNNVCPTGWKVPTSSDFTTLREYLDPGSLDLTNTAGIHLKTKGTDQWNSPNIGANNVTGFCGIPAGQRWNTGSYVFFGTRNMMLTSSPNGSAIFLYRLQNDELRLRSIASNLTFGSGAIRCLEE